MATKRKRIRFHFWLDDNNLTDIDVIPSIKKLKKQKQFTDVIRQGLRLIPSLMAGKVDVLFEMFPDIRKTLYLQMEADILEKMNVQQSEDIKLTLIKIEGIISQNINQSMVGSSMQGTVTMRRVTTEIEEEIELEIKKDEDAGRRASENFINSIIALNPPKNEPKKLAVKQFDAPSFDDDDDDLPMIVQTG